MEQGSAADTAAETDDCPVCGYTPRQKDRHLVADHDVVHVRCYRCGEEWVE